MVNVECKMHTREEKLAAFGRLLDVMDELREKCPWDRKQTNESLRPNTIEEVFELCDALMKDDDKNISKELGDVLMHVVFYSRIGSEKGVFDIADVCNQECDKLIFRHPHVGGFLLHAVGLDERGQAVGNSSKHGLVAVFLFQLDLFPILEHLVGCLGLGEVFRSFCFRRLRRIDVWMAEDELVGLLVAYVGNVELSLLLADKGVEHDVHDDVAQLFADVLRIVLDERIAEFKGFFNGVRAQALVGLLAVPRAFHPQLVQHIEQSPESLQFFFSCMWHIGMYDKLSVANLLQFVKITKRAADFFKKNRRAWGSAVLFSLFFTTDYSA